MLDVPNWTSIIPMLQLAESWNEEKRVFMVVKSGEWVRRENLEHADTVF